MLNKYITTFYCCLFKLCSVYSIIITDKLPHSYGIETHRIIEA